MMNVSKVRSSSRPPPPLLQSSSPLDRLWDSSDLRIDLQLAKPPRRQSLRGAELRSLSMGLRPFRRSLSSAFVVKTSEGTFPVVATTVCLSSAGMVFMRRDLCS